MISARFGLLIVVLATGINVGIGQAYLNDACSADQDCPLVMGAFGAFDLQSVCVAGQCKLPDGAPCGESNTPYGPDGPSYCSSGHCLPGYIAGEETCGRFGTEGTACSTD